MQITKKEMHFFFFSVYCIIFNCSWQLMMFDKKQKNCIKRFSNWWLFIWPKSFLQSGNCFYSSSMNDDEFINYYIFWHNFEDAINPLCSCGNSFFTVFIFLIEDWLSLPKSKLLANVFLIRITLSLITQILLFGDEKLSMTNNKSKFKKNSGRAESLSKNIVYLG